MTTATAAAANVEGSAYDIIKARLDEHGRKLQEKIEALNARRMEVFGGSELAVLANERVRTENNCVPRDILNVGGKLLFGYNVFIGLRKETRVEDAFAVHRCDLVDGAWNLDGVPLPPFLKDERFVKDFTELYKYYKDAELLQLRSLDSGRLLAVFKTGPSLRDLKVFRWAVDRKGAVEYLDADGLEDHTFPPTHGFEWTRATRENYVTGRFPHVNVLDTVFVETTGGDLTIKVENNTASGAGVYAEAVEDASQSLDDAQFFYAKVGALILLKVLPYREQDFRYFVFNTRSKEAHRVDAIAASCVELPEDHGIIFPGGFALATGEVKTFDFDSRGLTFERMVRSPNGEDVLYVFYEAATGRRALLAYNLIDKEVKSPILCHGWSLFDDGTLVVFRSDGGEPTRVHPMRIWRTPFVSADVAASQKTGGEFAGSLLVKVGNPEAVRAISDAHTIRRMVGNQKPTVKMYEDLIAECTRITDTYPWLGDEEVGNVAASVAEVRTTADLVVDEFEKIVAIQKAAAESLRQAEDKQRAVLSDVRPDSFTSIDPFLEAMKSLRTQRGSLITLMEQRYIDVPRLKALEKECADAFDDLTRKAGAFLQSDGALQPYIDKHDEIVKQGAEVRQASDCKPLLEELDRVQAGLQLLTEVTGQLKIDDAAARTSILEEIAGVIAQLNRARAVLDGKRKDLLKQEGASELGAQTKLLSQAIESALSMADTPERCDQELARLLVTVEELEGRFAELDDAVAVLAEKREKIFESLTAKKQQLLDERNRRAQNMMTSAQRILDGVKRRAMASKSVDELNSAFAADPMIEKARAIAADLAALGDTVKSEEVLSKLKSVRSEALRQVRDKSEMFVEGEGGGGPLVQLGKHRFTVNTQAFDVTLLPRKRDDGSPGLAIHLTGTDYFEDIDPKAPEGAALLSFADLFDEPLVSEGAALSRAEFLAMSILLAAERGDLAIPGDAADTAGVVPAAVAGVTPAGATSGAAASGAASSAGRGKRALEDAARDGTLEALVSGIARSRYDEGYDRGVHDADAARILGTVLGLQRQAGLLRHSPKARALAVLFMAAAKEEEGRALLAARLRGAARLLRAHPQSKAALALVDDVGREIASFLERSGVGARLGADAGDARAAAAYLLDEVGNDTATAAPAVPAGSAAAAAGDGGLGGVRFVLSREAEAVVDRVGDVTADLGSLDGHIGAQVALALAWVDSVVDAGSPAALEAVAHLVTRGRVERVTADTAGSIVVEGLLSRHPRIAAGKLTLRLDDILDRARRFIEVRVPRFLELKKRRADVVDTARRRLKIDELKPRVLSSFVRNQLVNDVYLPLIGDNLAKQMGAAGASKRTDLMGMLLLISPPGYGKTTLMEYVASRLGLVYVKANGPALGHETTSLDPAEAPNATARQEVDKINFAFEMGNNVLLLLDDIQHTNPELLQKFISLCDGTRRVEGVWHGRTRTYDLRGKKLVVCMAGNPYTESGEKFKIPDMLANRADTYNLGDILGGREREFALSYVENALTSNPVLQPLASRDPADIKLLVRMAQGEQVPSTDLKYGYSGAEIDEIVRVLQKLIKIQQTLLKVNATYISSAATDERFRTEPPFKLQGSYRNMNKLAEKVVSVMNDDELERLVDDHYRSEAQTLTTGAEVNLLKLAELRNRLSPEERARWAEIKNGYARAKMQGSDSDDPATRVTNTLAGLAQRVEQIAGAITAASARPAPVLEAPAVHVNVPAQSAPTVEVKVPQHVAPALDPVLVARLDQVIEALMAARLDVKVTSPAPAGIAELVRLQTILIEASLLPIVKALSSSIEHEKGNAKRLEEVLEELKALEEKGLPAPQPAQNEVYRPFKPRPAGVRREEE